MNFRALWGNPFNSRGSFNASISFLSSVPLFDKLSKRQLMKIHDIIHIREFKTNEIIFRQGDPGVGMYIVREGQVKVCMEHDDCTYNDIVIMESGDFFGEISLLNDSPRSATIIAMKESVLFGLFREDLIDMMDSDPRLGLSIIYSVAQIIAERLRLTTSGSGVHS